MGMVEESPENVALIIGVTGLVGKELARATLSSPAWKKVYGVARNPDDTLVIPDGTCVDYQFIACDLLKPEEVAERLSPLADVTHLFWVTWATLQPLDTPECCDLNRSMMSNVLDAVLPSTMMSLKHVSLQTGAKHYVSIKDGCSSTLYYDEESPRVEGANNFYYALEDLLKERLKVSWSVHRPGLIIGSSKRTLFNFMGTLCVYASLCKHLGLPFVFGGERLCWEEPYMDASDARLVAQQQIWASTHEGVVEGGGHAFNAVNGPRFTWKEVWPALAEKFGLEMPEEPFDPTMVYSMGMADKGEAWEGIVEKGGLRETKMGEIANWWLMDAMFRCPVKMLLSRAKVDGMGFSMTYEMTESLSYWVDRMREEKLIP
ncbi:3-oxo-Delta(4,5)-steroid 5-beta-reductase [Acorus calamus]|uniref:3-oxo-Delta(4,5)-steroid 5-beta-reductase n=1 Tax=Acorus calamus TaxID=4465 RepID=A0AAV9DBT5_ACOCL|nr:3-oxo-Delta(4,5)-steroid 5-beta-reductase [Acorus calamus]